MGKYSKVSPVSFYLASGDGEEAALFLVIGGDKRGCLKIPRGSDINAVTVAKDEAAEVLRLVDAAIEYDDADSLLKRLD